MQTPCEFNQISLKKTINLKRYNLNINSLSHQMANKLFISGFNHKAMLIGTCCGGLERMMGNRRWSASTKRAVTSVQTNENWGSMETTREYYFGIGRVWLSLLEIGGVRNDVDIRSRTRFLLDIFDSVINYIEKMSI